MKARRVTIAGLMYLTAISAVGFVALRESTLIWASAVFTLVIATFLAASVVALLARERRRASAIGFCLFGWTTLALALGPLSLHHRGAPPLVFGPLANFAYARIHPAPANVGITWQAASNNAQPIIFQSGGSTVPGGSSPSWTLSSNVVMLSGGTAAPPAAPPFVHQPEHFEQVYLSLAALLMGLAGAFWARREHRRRLRSASLP